MHPSLFPHFANLLLYFLCCQGATLARSAGCMVAVCSYIHFLMEDVFGITFPSVVSYLANQILLPFGLTVSHFLLHHLILFITISVP